MATLGDVARHVGLSKAECRVLRTSCSSVAASGDTLAQSCCRLRVGVWSRSHRRRIVHRTYGQLLMQNLLVVLTHPNNTLNVDATARMVVRRGCGV